MLQRRLLQTHAHPRLFRQLVQLTDGSTVRVVSLSGQRPFVKVGVDALSHPSWNPQLLHRMRLSEHGEVAKFRERFADVNDTCLQEFDGMFGPAPAKTASPAPSPAAPSKDKKTKAAKK